jgi:hypothetical protein
VQKLKKVNEVSEASGNTIYLPDRDARIAELFITKVKAEVSSRASNLRNGLRQSRNFCCSEGIERLNLKSADTLLCRCLILI